MFLGQAIYVLRPLQLRLKRTLRSIVPKTPQVQKTLFAFHFRIPPLSARSPPNPAAPLGLRRAIYPMSRPLADENPESFAPVLPTSNIRKARRDAASG